MVAMLPALPGICSHGPGDLKWGFKLSLEYPLRHQRCSQKLFFPKLGSKWSPLLTKGQKRRSATQHTITQRPVKWKRMVLETRNWA